MHQPDVDQAVRFFNEYVYVDDDHCAEVRILQARVDFSSRMITRADPAKSSTVVGWFTRGDMLACELRRVRNASAYITINPVRLKGRPPEARNTLVHGRKGMFATDDDISYFRYVVFDVDRQKVHTGKRTNASAEELAACREMAARVVSDLRLAGHSKIGCSGNGYYVLTRVPDTPNDAGGRANRRPPGGLGRPDIQERALLRRSRDIQALPPAADPRDVEIQIR